MYLLTSVADLVRICEPSSDVANKFVPALHRLWSNMIEKKSYVTGGIGAMKQWRVLVLIISYPMERTRVGVMRKLAQQLG